MELRVVWPWGSKRNINKYSIYYIYVQDNGHHRPADKAEMPRLESLTSRIAKMCRHVLGSDFLSVQPLPGKGCLVLSVTKGLIHSGRKADLDRLRGWIELCDTE